MKNKLQMELTTYKAKEMAKILIAEDERESRRLLVKIATKLGHFVIESPHGRHAWETICHNENINLLITDVMMPVLDGKALVELVRGDDTFNELPILIVSAVISEDEISDLLELGATAFMKKPYQIDEIEEYFQKYLG